MFGSQRFRMVFASSRLLVLYSRILNYSGLANFMRIETAIAKVISQIELSKNSNDRGFD